MEENVDKPQKLPQPLSSLNTEQPQVTPTPIIKYFKNKYSIPIVIILSLLIIFTALVCLIYFKISKIDGLSSSTTVGLTPSQTFKTLQRNTTLTAFIRKGDVWIGSIDGSNLKQITTHPQLNYTIRGVEGNGPPLKVDYTNYYAKYPRLSYDGRYLAYISLTQESVDDIQERGLRIATESAEIKAQGMSEIFNDPKRDYSLHVYNIPEQKEESLNYFENISSSQDIVGNFNLLKWAASRNILYFIKDYNLQFVYDSYDQPKDSLTHAFILKNYCGFNCMKIYKEVPDEASISVSSNGNKIAGVYSTGKNCSTSLEFKLLTVDLATRQISQQPQNVSSCHVVVGPWIDNNFIAVEYKNNEKYSKSETGAVFYKYNSNNWDGKEKMFEDNDYQFKGPLALSPNNKYLAYPAGNKYTYGSIGKVDLRIRDLETQEYFDLLKLTQDNKGLNGDKILYAKWDSDSSNLYFTLTNDKGSSSNLVKLNINSKEPVIIIEDATDSDIN